MNIISKKFYFSASHQLIGLKEEHPCGRLHGHNYCICIFLKGKPNKNGFVQDYGDLGLIEQWIKENLEHRHLNDVFNFQPSVENISKFIFDLFKKEFPLLFAVEMSESSKTNCRYEDK
jgi:6-pyruvoyltetrahydropterin/6-carboxytetrahydropterin synthase